MFFKSKRLSKLLNISFLFLLTLFLYQLYTQHPNPSLTHNSLLLHNLETNSCTGLHDLPDYPSKCLYVTSRLACKPKGYINYLQIFYCTFGQLPSLGYALLLLWLVVLFYLLGDTAATYFCSSLENLSEILKLSPTLAGVTLLSLGNGSPDVFSSIVSFTKSDNGDFGINSILGGAFFVSCFVVGIICMMVDPDDDVSVDKSGFIRDVLFCVLALVSLLLIIFIGRINIYGALCFVSIYFLYVIYVSLSHFLDRKKQNELEKPLDSPLLCNVDEDQKPVSVDGNQNRKQDSKKKFKNLEKLGVMFLKVLDLPLYLPRRLTIPVVEEKRWSKPFAITSVTLSPLLLAQIFNFQTNQNMGFNSKTSIIIYLISGFIGLILGVLAFFTTQNQSPPKKFLFPWLLGGFLMSVTWTYIIANELVSLLVSIGDLLAIDPSLLGLTILAWGNSLGDIIANVTMAMNGGARGVQISISGCYAGPMFNTLIGLGIPFVYSALAEYPNSYVIPIDTSLYETLGFFIGGLLWAVLILPRKNMRLDRLLGGGLMAIYFCFLFLRLARMLGVS